MHMKKRRPREGTKTFFVLRSTSLDLPHEKKKTPRGDENPCKVFFPSKILSDEKKKTPRGDENSVVSLAANVLLE